MEEIIITKYININAKTNDYVNLINNYHDIVDNFKIYYTNQVNYKLKECDEFKEEINNSQQKQQLDKKIYLKNYSTKLENNFKEFIMNYKKN